MGLRLRVYETLIVIQKVFFIKYSAFRVEVSGFRVEVSNISDYCERKLEGFQNIYLAEM